MYSVYLLEIQRELNYLLNKRLKEFGIGRYDIQVMRIINAQDGVNQSTICSILKEDKITVSKAVKKLSEAGYVDKRKDSDDKRVTNIYMTSEGARVRAKILEVIEETNRELIQNLDENEKKELEKLLIKVSNGAKKISSRLENE